MTFEYALSWADYDRLSRHLRDRSVGKLKYIAIPLTILFATAPLTMREALGPEPKSAFEIYRALIGCLIFPALYVLILFSSKQAARRLWQKSEQLRELKQYTIDEAGIAADGASASGFSKWETMKSAGMIGDLVFIRNSMNLYFIFSLSSLPPSANPAQLLQLIVGNVPVAKHYLNAFKRNGIEKEELTPEKPEGANAKRLIVIWCVIMVLIFAIWISSSP